MTLFQKYYASVVKAAILALLVGFAAACGDKDGGGSDVPPQNEIYWKNSSVSSSTVASSTTSSALIIDGVPGTRWNAQVTEGTSWCSFKYGNYTGDYTATEGTVQEGLNILYVYYQNNTGADQRTAEVRFNFEGQNAQDFTVTQLAQSQDDEPHFTAWAELPAMKQNANYAYATHYASLNKKKVRNYSICFDKARKAALWVAYPLHSVYISGNGHRTDAWAFDPTPTIPERDQANCIRKSYGGPYDRGHQLPSADRLATDELNAQTFYMTNMTPQLNRLNQDMWAKLESKVRTYRCSDTLYVVTGAYFGTGYKTTTDGAGNSVPIPTNYFKVLLRTRSGNTGKAVTEVSADDLMAIGFWVEQRSYGNIEPPKSICMSVADIEAKTGFTFFSTLSSSVAASVKKQNNPSQWGIN